MASRVEDGRFSWLARHVTMYIAQGYQLGEKEENVAFNRAKEIAFDEIEKAMLGGHEPVQHENAPGSYERLMGGFSQLEARGKTL